MCRCGWESMLLHRCVCEGIVRSVLGVTGCDCGVVKV